MKYPIIFIDSGDTIIDETTEIRDEHGDVIDAHCIPGAAETLRILHDEGYTLIMVADGTHNSFENVYHRTKLYDYYAGRIYSEDVGVEKPHPRMFETAMALLPDIPRDRIIMVGNNLARDIIGANRFGITSVFIDWSSRYPHTLEDPEAQPDYIIHTPGELLPLVRGLHRTMTRDAAAESNETTR